MIPALLVALLLSQDGTCKAGATCRAYAFQPPCVATANLPACAASTKGRTMCDLTQNCTVYCNGSAWACIATYATSPWSSDGGTVYTPLNVQIANGKILTLHSSASCAQMLGNGALAISCTTPGYAFNIGTSSNTFVSFSAADNIWHNHYGTWQFENTLANPVRFYAPVAINTGGKVTDSPTAPTISSGFGTTPAITTTGGTASFRVTVGNPTGASGVLTMPAAANGWNCTCDDMTTHSATVFRCRQTASTTTSVTIGNFNNTPASANWVAADVLLVQCRAY